MELRHIRYFLAVAEEGHFTRAAAKIGIGQPPLSQQIRDLEEEIGTPLFHRVAHGAELTEAGKAFLAGVRQMPLLAERAAIAAQRAARGETGSLRVGFISSAAFNAVVVAAIRAFRRAYSDVYLTLEEASTMRLLAGLHEGSLDAAFLRPGEPGYESLEYHLLSEEPMMVALPESHPATQRQEIDIAALKGDALVLFPREMGPTLYDTIIATCRRAGFDPKIGQMAPQLASVVTLVAAELGVSIVPASMSQLRIKGVAYRPIGGQPPIARLGLAHRHADTSPVVRNFVARVIASAKEAGDPHEPPVKPAFAGKAPGKG